MRLEFLTQVEALAKAGAIHTWLIANDAGYARSVQRGQTTAWAIPYEEGGKWYVNCKERCRNALSAAEVLLLKPYATRVSSEGL